VIVFRQVDARYPFLWEDATQPAGRWHADGEGPVHYFADTPDGAWAEFLRHEEITDPDDLSTIRRQIWAVDIGDAPLQRVELPEAVLTGGRDTYSSCQQEARVMRDRGISRVVAVTAALMSGGARAMRVDGGVRVAEPQDGETVVIFGTPSDLRGWIAGNDAAPPPDLIGRVRHY
jgi:hypothetical protein